MTTYRASAVYRNATLRAQRQRAAMNHRIAELGNVGKRALSLKGYVHHGVG